MNFLKKINPSPFLRDIIFTTLTSVLTVACLIGVTRLLAVGLPPEDFGAYMLARRLLSTIDPFSTFCMAIALTRYVAISKEPHTADRFFIGGVILGVVPALLIALIGMSAPEFFARCFFQSESYKNLWLVTLWITLAYSIYIVLYSFYRATNQLHWANAWQLFAIAVGPLAVAWIYSKTSSAWLVLVMGGILFTAIFPLVKNVGAAWRRSGGCGMEQIRALAVYGAWRIPSGLAFGGLLMMGAFFASHQSSLREAGYLAVGIAMLRIVEGGSEAFGRVALPRFAQMLSHQSPKALGGKIVDILNFLLCTGLYASLHLALWAGEITVLWLGKDYVHAVPVMQIMALTVLPYLLFVTLRSVVDAISEKAINTRNLLICLAVGVVCCWVSGKLGGGVGGLAWSTSLAFIALSGMTVHMLKRECDFRMSQIQFFSTILLNIALILIAWLVKFFLFQNDEITWAALPKIALTEAVLTLAYLWLLWLLGAQWMRELARRLIPTLK